MKIGLLFSVTLLSVVGCTVGGGIQTKRIAFVMPPGYSKGESDDKSVTVGVPPGWKFGVDTLSDALGGFGASNNGPADPNAPKLTPEEQKSMDNLMKGMNEMSKEQEEAHLDRLKKDGYILMCVSQGKQTIGEDRTRFYVKKETQNSNWTWEEAAAAQKDKLKSAPSPKQVTLPIGQAYRMQETWQKVDGAMHTVIIYAIPSGRDLYSLRFITDEPAEVVTSIDKSVAESLRIN